MVPEVVVVVQQQQLGMVKMVEQEEQVEPPQILPVLKEEMV